MAQHGPLRLALTRREAAAALGVSLTAFEQHVQPHLALIKVGRKLLVPVRELERWLENATHPPASAPAAGARHSATRCATVARRNLVALTDRRR